VNVEARRYYCRNPRCREKLKSPGFQLRHHDGGLAAVGANRWPLRDSKLSPPSIRQSDGLVFGAMSMGGWRQKKKPAARGSRRDRRNRKPRSPSLAISALVLQDKPLHAGQLIDPCDRRCRRWPLAQVHQGSRLPDGCRIAQL